MMKQKVFHSITVVLATILTLVGFVPLSQAITFDNRDIIDHWDDPLVQDAYYHWDQYVQINSKSKTDTYNGDQYNAQGIVENDWLTIGPITDNTNLLLLYAAIIGAANPMATGEGNGWYTILEAPNWTVDLQPDHVIQGGATVTFYIVNSNGQGRKGMPVEITTDASIPTPPLNPDSSTDTTTSTTDSSSEPSSDSSTDTITGTTDPSSDSTTNTTTSTTDSGSEPSNDSSTDTTTSTTESSSEPSSDSSTDMTTSTTESSSEPSSDSSTDMTTSTTESSSEPSSDSTTDMTTSTTDSSSEPNSDSTTNTTTSTTDSGSEPSNDSSTDTTTSTTESSSEPSSDSTTDTTTSTTDSSTTEILGTNERNSSSMASAIAPSSKQTPSSAKRYPQTNMEPDQLFFTFLGTGLLVAAVFLGFSRKH